MISSSNSKQNQNAISIENVEFRFDQKIIYANVSIQIPSSGVCVIMGPSGCGKSTLLNLICGRLRPHRGDVKVFCESVPQMNNEQLYAMRRRIGMMFQSTALLTDLSVFQNVAFPIEENSDLQPTLVRKLVLMKLEQVGLRGAADLMPSELSGGMGRRVALARATALDPDIILFDEPFVGLDPISLGIITKLIREQTDALNAASVIVTHDVEEGLGIADHAFLLGDGGLLAAGTPQDLLSSKQPEVRQFLHGLPDGPVSFHYPSENYLESLSIQN